MPVRRHRRGLWERAVGSGEIGVWFCGLCLNLTVLMAVGLLALVAWNSFRFFWPSSLVRLDLDDGSIALGVVWDEEEAEGSHARENDRIQLKVGNRRAFGLDFRWIDLSRVETRSRPPEVVAIERTEYGDLYGWLEDLRRDGRIVAEREEAWKVLPEHLEETEVLLERAEELEGEMAGINTEVEHLRLRIRSFEMESGGPPGEVADLRARMQEQQQRFEELRRRLEDVFSSASAPKLSMLLSDGQIVMVPLSSIVRIYKPNELGLLEKTRLYLAKWWEFLTGEPRESNTEGGVFPALFGTFFLVVLMSMAAVPLGVVAALYLGEYAQEGPLVRAVRIAVQNLAGVPSIVFGVFGLGFFVYGVGGTLDKIFFAEKLPTPTFGTGGVLWASLTLALLTVPVVIVATEEAIRAVPKSLRQASYGLGATQWQTVRRVILPAALPGILTGLILAVARGAGEVAPLMITGVVKLAPALPVDGEFPFLHLDRKFMHLAFHIYDVGFQSPNVEAAKPMVYMTTLLLLTMVVVLNLIAIQVRNRLRERYKTSAV